MKGLCKYCRKEKVFCKGFCKKCYERNARNGFPERIKNPPGLKCKECGQPAYSKEFCLACYSRNYRNGSPKRILQISGSKRIRKGYVVFTMNGKEIREHVSLMEKKIGRKLLPDEVVHHKNGIRNDNRIENLEVLTNGEHARLHNNARTCRRSSESAQDAEKFL